MNKLRESIPAVVTRIRIAEIPSPQLFHKKLLRQIELRSYFAGFAQNDDWNLGFATVKGNVREDNQDYGVAFNYEGHQILLLADGMGGLTRGGLASFLAVSSASNTILSDLHTGMNTNELLELSATALEKARFLLACCGDKLNIITSGLRTTLIIVISNESHASLTYIGDGAVYHYKSATECQALLEPQKAFPGNLSLLSASLGPTVHGKPRSRVFKRVENDLIIAMTDGIADRIYPVPENGSAPMVISNFVSNVETANANLQEAVTSTVNDLANYKDDEGYICNDNVSLGCLSNMRHSNVLVGTSIEDQRNRDYGNEPETQFCY